MNRKRNWKSPSCLDIKVGGTTFHGNYQAARNVDQTVSYVKKGGDFISNLQVSVWERAVNASTREEAEMMLMKECPKQYVTQYPAIDAFLKSKEKMITYVTPYPLETFHWTDKMRQWMSQIGQGLRRCQLLVLRSPPSFGKTHWARSIGPHCYMRGQFNLKKLMENKNWQYLILDDMALDKDSNFWMNSKRSLLLGDGEGDFTDKYCAKVTITAQGKPCVWLTNEPMEYYFQSEMWREQVIFEELENKLFI